MDDGPIILPFRRPDEAGQRPRTSRPAAEPPVWDKWRDDAEMTQLIRWLADSTWPDDPFDLVPPDGDPAVVVRVVVPQRYRAALLADAARGPAEANVVGLRIALRRLRAVLGGQGREASATASGPAGKGRKRAAGGQ